MLSDCCAALAAPGAGDDGDEDEDRSPSVGVGACGVLFGGAGDMSDAESSNVDKI